MGAYWLELLDAAQGAWLELSEIYPPNVRNEAKDRLRRALLDPEMEEHRKGRVGNLIDETGDAPQLWRRELTQEDKDGIVAAVWNWYAFLYERAEAHRDGDESGEYGAGLAMRLKTDALVRLLDSLADERIAGAWKME